MSNAEDKINKKIEKMILKDADTQCGTPLQCKEAKEQAIKLQEDMKNDLQVTNK